MADDVSIAGLDEFYRQLQQFPANVEANVMRGAIRAGLTVIRDEAETLAPEKTGALRKSIRVRFQAKHKKYGWVRGQVVAGNPEAWYSHIIEFGSGSFYSGTGTRSKRAPYEIRPRGAKSLFFAGIMRDLIVHPGVKPTGFMRRAFDNKMHDALEAVETYLSVRIPKEFAKK
jgi:HK97 gp10 family phage protein